MNLSWRNLLSLISGKNNKQAEMTADSALSNPLLPEQASDITPKLFCEYDYTNLSQEQRTRLRAITTMMQDGYLSETNYAGCKLYGKISAA